MTADKNLDRCKSRVIAFPLVGISERKPEDKMADRHAEAAVDIRRQPPKSTGSRDRYSGVPTSRLPTEIYQMIVKQIVLHYDNCSYDQKDIRAKTLSSLACTSTTLQCLTEPYLYSFPEYSRLKSSRGLNRFQLSLAVSSRRENLVQALEIEWGPQISSQLLVIDIARRCPNLRTLILNPPETEWQKDEFSQTCNDNLANLFSVCPKVRNLCLATYFPEDFPIPEQDRRIEEFAGQLSHVDFSGSGSWAEKALLPYLSPNIISFIMTCPEDDLTGFLEILGQRCPVLQRLRLTCLGITPEELATLCKGLGSTLKLLCLDDLDYNGSVLSLFVPHMKVLEHLILGANFPLQGQDLEVMSGLSCLRTFISDVRNDSISNLFLGEADIDLNRAVASFLSAHRTTLETMWIASLHNWDSDVFENLKLVPNLGSVGLSFMEGLERQDIDDLLKACPKLQEALDLEERLDGMFNGGTNSHNLSIGFQYSKWWMEDPPGTG
ncbi:uncharacterized protein FSUBG_7881 [Fusarium subglutinans]|uniref:Uncharacterized protein n=1 Tax=Gibberella subglutinans TaxID=42677 RepID=A0A8H5UWU4_GIBSU|nr:uncharacterized protein FSUBG_7881 [Fusarium subglutinans]KAF5602206.1 hypothetical protein FSUBG_7881 [Fusarium subglutinans]